MKQLGACPMGMRWGASSDMGQELSHIWIDQFTYWDSCESHPVGGLIFLFLYWLEKAGF